MPLKKMSVRILLLSAAIGFSACGRQNQDSNQQQPQPINPQATQATSNVEFGPAIALVRQDLSVRISEQNCQVRRGRGAECTIDLLKELGIPELPPGAQLRLALRRCEPNDEFCIRRQHERPAGQRDEYDQTLIGLNIESRSGLDILSQLRAGTVRAKMTYLGPQL